MTEGELMLADPRRVLGVSWKVGWQRVEKTDWEAVATWSYYLDRFKSLFGGADFLGEGGTADKVRDIVGLRYLLPLNFESRTWLDTDLGGRITLAKEFTLAPRLILDGEIDYDTHTR